MVMSSTIKQLLILQSIELRSLVNDLSDDLRSQTSDKALRKLMAHLLPTMQLKMSEAQQGIDGFSAEDKRVFSICKKTVEVLEQAQKTLLLTSSKNSGNSSLAVYYV